MLTNMDKIAALAWWGLHKGLTYAQAEEALSSNHQKQEIYDRFEAAQATVPRGAPVPWVDGTVPPRKAKGQHKQRANKQRGG